MSIMCCISVEDSARSTTSFAKARCHPDQAEADMISKHRSVSLVLGLVFLTQLACLAACNLWEPEELHHKSERDAHLALLRGWCLEEGRTAPKVNAMAGNVLRLGPCGTGGSQVIKEDRTSAHSETM
ncbi:uncharacterized protein LOC115321801 isoform X5 [Ixodes scapularis]|uniref:uncharacterized protein LOC115321801 isoform X5 n=1 Tax=Ixodes scapularis TaxID=6945 RepID=UPI001A9DF574|nr:uncharacterized protein LOC115321801 isoform X5 [Ixodes scapularis]